MPDQSAKPDLKQEKAEAFFDTITHHDLQKLRRSMNAKIYVALFFMFIVTVLSILLAFSHIIRPTPVIAFDKMGKALVFPDTSAETSTSDPRIRYFVSEFVKLYDGVSPHPDEDITKAYNMMVPKLREILLLQGAHAKKVEEWKGKNIESVFTIDKINSKGSPKVGSKIAVIGTGKMLFRPAVSSAYDTSNTFTRYFFFKSQLIVLPVTLSTPSGLMVEYYSSDAFDDEMKLKAYLMQNNVPLLEEGGVAQ